MSIEGADNGPPRLLRETSGVTSTLGRTCLPTVVIAASRAFPDLGGLESHVDTVSQHLTERGFHISIETTDRSAALDRVTRRGRVTICRSRGWPTKRDYYFSPILFLRLISRRYDLLHVQGINALVPPVAMLAGILSRRPFVVTFHSGGATNALRRRLRTVQFTMLAPLLRRASALIAVSEYEAKVFADIIKRPDQPIRVIRNGGLPPVETSTPVSVDPDLILSVGRLEKYKGHHRAIEALPHILRSRPGAHLRILGTGPYRGELLALADTLGVRHRVEFDFVPPEKRDQMARELSQAGLVVLLSDYEAHPVAVMEALALSRPVLVFRTSGLIELAEQDLLVAMEPSSDPEAVADAILNQLQDPFIAKSVRLPTWEQCVDGIEEVYRSVLRTRGRRSDA